MESKKYSSVASGLIGLAFLGGLLGIKFTFPIFLLFLPAFYLTRFLPAETWERWTLVPFLSLFLAVLVVFGSLFIGSYSPTKGFVIIIALNIFSIVQLLRVSKGFKFSFKVKLKELGTPFLISAGGFLLILALLLFYGMTIAFPSFWSGPYCAYVQRGLNIVRTGSFHFLEPSQSCFNMIPFFYPPAFPALTAWISSLVSVDLVNSTLGYVAPLFLFGLCGIFLAVGYRQGWKCENVLLSLLLLLPSYAIFVIFTHIDSDTPGLACSALFFYLLIRLRSSEKKSEKKSIWLFVILAWALSWWIRSYLGILFTFTLFSLFIFSSRFRKDGAALFNKSKKIWRRPLLIGGIIGAILFGPFWEWLMWIHTGSPLAPFSVAPAGIEIATMESEFNFYEPPFKKGSQDKAIFSAKDKIKLYMKEFSYDYFPVVLNEGWKKNVFKTARAVFHGNTFSILFSFFLFTGIGFGLLSIRKKGIYSPEGIGILVLSGVALIFLTNTYYRKILYAGFPQMVFFVGLSLSWFFGKMKSMEKGANVFLSLFLTLVFVGSFFYTGIGTWPKDRRWGILKTDFGSADSREELRNGFSLTPVAEALKDVDPKEKFLYFHLEPGITLAYKLDRRPFWDEYHYESQKLAGLHRLDTREKVLAALNQLDINYLVFTYQFERFFNRTDPEILPKMIYEKDPALQLVAVDKSRVYRVYKVNE